MVKNSEITFGKKMSSNYKKMLDIEKKAQMERIKRSENGEPVKDLFTIRESAKILNISIQLVDKLIRTKELKVMRIGNNRRIEKVALAEYRARRNLVERFPDFPKVAELEK